MELLKAREYQEALTQPEGAARNAEEILHVGIKTRGLNGPWFLSCIDRRAYSSSSSSASSRSSSSVSSIA